MAAEAAKAGVEKARKPTDDPTIVEQAKERAADLAMFQALMADEFLAFLDKTDVPPAEPSTPQDAIEQLGGLVTRLVIGAAAAAAARRIKESHRETASSHDISGEGDPGASHREVGAGLRAAPGDGLGLHGGLRTLDKKPEEC